MRNPLISIVTVVYNDAKTIEHTLRCSISQTYVNKEIIVIDGNSSDGTCEIVEKYKKNIGIYISEPDKGIYDAMNKGVRLAKGEWVCFMNSGDSFYNDHVLENVAPFLKENDDIVYGNTDCITQYGHIIDYAKPPSFIKENMPCSHQSCFTKASLLKEHPFNLSFKIVADYNFMFQSFKRGKAIKKIDLIVATYNAAEGFSASNKYGSLKEILRIHNYGILSKITIKLLIQYGKYFILEYFNGYFPSIVKMLRGIKHKN